MSKFSKIKRLMKGTGLPEKLTASLVHSYDKAPDETLKEDKRLKLNKKVVKI